MLKRKFRTGYFLPGPETVPTDHGKAWPEEKAILTLPCFQAAQAWGASVDDAHNPNTRS